MSSNRSAQASRIVLIAALAGVVGACATPLPPPGSRANLTPTEQYTIKVTERPDQILLAPHADGLSRAQTSALADLVDRWREAGGGPILIQAPSHGGGEAYRAATNVQGELGALGVSEDQIRMAGYESEAGATTAPIMVGFDHYEAQGSDCGRKWDDFTKTAANRPNSNFGCAVTSNIAAMVANPADLAHARPMDPADAGRREAVLAKYRQGQVTSTAKDDQASGAISSVVH